MYQARVRIGAGVDNKVKAKIAKADSSTLEAKSR